MLYAFFWVIPQSEFRRWGITQKKAYNIYRTFCQNQVQEFGGENKDSMAIL
jgi:deoxyribodipyrimidine photolyase-like uncharacterized protein